jgi:cold shock CspA family protein
MEIPSEIILKHVKMTQEIDKLINRGIAKLEQTCDYIVSVRIALGREQARHQTGNPYRMRIDVGIPNRPAIVVSRSSKAAKSKLEDITVSPRLNLQKIESESVDDLRIEFPKKMKVREEPLQALINRTFESVRRRLEKEVERQRGEEKTPAQSQSQGMIEKLFRDQGYGFLRTLDGQQAYFNQNSVLHNHWESLTAGTMVRYALELGEKGLQASTVELVSKPGVAEKHDVLHDIAVKR